MDQQTSTSSAQILDKMWKTAKCRMGAEARYRRYHLAANLSISYYSLLVILTSVFTAELGAYIPSVEKVIIALSIAVFCASLVLLGFRFSETADRHRECYLRLQRILDNPASVDLSNEYHNVLEHYPNHDERDYSNLVVESAIFRRRPITDASKNPVPVSWLTIFYYFLRLGLWILTWSVMAIAPFALGVLLSYLN